MKHEADAEVIIYVIPDSNNKIPDKLLPIKIVKIFIRNMKIASTAQTDNTRPHMFTLLRTGASNDIS